MKTIGFALLVAASLAAQETTPRAEPAAGLAGGEVYEWTSSAGAPYWYRVPEKISKTSPPNLVLMLHGTGMKWGWAFWNYPIKDGTVPGGRHRRCARRE